LSVEPLGQLGGSGGKTGLEHHCGLQLHLLKFKFKEKVKRSEEKPNTYMAWFNQQSFRLSFLPNQVRPYLFAFLFNLNCKHEAI
jgi:hypothetical protein